MMTWLRNLNPWRAVPQGLLILLCVNIVAFFIQFVVTWELFFITIGVIAAALAVMAAITFTIAWWSERAEAWDKAHGKNLPEGSGLPQ